jgi:hypothetical protein
MSDPFKDFDAHFQRTSERIDRVHDQIDRARKWAVPAAIASGGVSLAFVGFVCWAIYKLVTHFAG